MRPARRIRGFRIVDGLVAIGVTALGLVWARSYWGATIRSIPDWSWTMNPNNTFWRYNSDPFYNSTRELILIILYVGTTLAASLGVALVFLRRVRHPGTPFWRARRPGAMACLVSTAVLVLILAIQALWPSSQDRLHFLVGPYSEIRAVSTVLHHDDAWGWRDNTDPLLNTSLEMPRWAGFVVAGSWLALVLAGRWRPERSWIDRLGRGIGVFWVVAALHFLFLPL